MTVKRFCIEEEILRSVYEELRSRGYSQRDIGNEIGSDFKNHLYKGTSLSREAFKSLEELYGKKIPHEKKAFLNGCGFSSELSLDKDDAMAELVGIVLGDGHLDKHSEQRDGRYIANYYVSVTLHSEEKSMRSHVASIMNEKFRKRPTVAENSSYNAVSLRVYGKRIVEAMESVGIESGNKVENQVGVPEWVKSDREFVKKCLRGLVDTDGSVYERTHNKYIIHFKNRSQQLLEDFRELCGIIDVKTSKAGEYAVQVAAQEEVEKFIEKVDPVKARQL